MGWVLVAHIVIKFCTQKKISRCLPSMQLNFLLSALGQQIISPVLTYQLRFHTLLEQTCVIVANATVASTSLTL